MSRVRLQFPAFSPPCLLFRRSLTRLQLRSTRRTKPLTCGRLAFSASLRDDDKSSVNSFGVPPPEATPAVPSASASYPKLGVLNSVPRSWQNGFLLTLVPFLWGSYGVAAKFLFDTSHPMPLSLLNLSSFIFAWLSAMFMRSFQFTAAAPLPSLRPSYWAGLELGTFWYLGTWLNLEAVARTSASRTAFFVQLTTIMVPLSEWVLGAKVEPQVFGACVIAMTGVGVLSQSADPTVVGVPGTVLGALNVGDLTAIASAVLYSVTALRLERLSDKSMGATVLVETKTIAQVMWSALSVALVMWQGDTEVGFYVSNFLTMPIGEIISAVWWSFWIGAGTSTLSSWAQIVGQERVGPSRAAVYYASQPIFGAGLAYAVGMDRLSVQEVLGGALIVAAGALLAIGDHRDEPKGSDKVSSK